MRRITFQKPGCHDVEEVGLVLQRYETRLGSLGRQKAEVHRNLAVLGILEHKAHGRGLYGNAAILLVLPGVCVASD